MHPHSKTEKHNNQWFICNLPNALQNTKLNFNCTKKAIGQLKQEAAKGPLGRQIKQPPILFKNSAVWRMLQILMKQPLIFISF